MLSYREYKWVSGDSSTYTNWNVGEPSDSDEKCGRVYGSGLGAVAGFWNNDLCTKKSAFICEVNAADTPTPVPTPEPKPVPFTCGSPARSFTFHTKQMAWDQADAFCREEHPEGALASIHSAAENK